MSAADVLVIQNITREKPGLLADIMQQRGISYETVDLDQGESLPPVKDYSAVVVMGGPDSANDDTPKMRSELAFAKTVIEQDIPYLGICLGLQVGVKASGGQVVKGQVKEVGFHDHEGKRFTVELTEAGRHSSLFVGMDKRFAVFQLHGETVELTPSMQLLATGKHCHNQIVQIAPRAFGIQSHFELTPQMLQDWAAADPDLKPFDAQKLQADFQEIKDEYKLVAITLFNNYLDIAGFMK